MTATATVKHTPGIWKVGHAGTQRRPVVVAARAGRPVTVATFDSGNKDEDEANALVSAAAPDLLAALKATEQQIFCGCFEGADDFDSATGNHEPGCFIPLIRAALAKAEGRTS